MADHPAEPAHEVGITPGQVLRFRYKNWRGVTANRIARFEALVYASTEWHRQPQWLIRAIDLDTGETRLFALQDMVPLDSKESSTAS
jgi:hypothetical protein